VVHPACCPTPACASWPVPVAHGSYPGRGGHGEIGELPGALRSPQGRPPSDIPSCRGNETAPVPPLSYVNDQHVRGWALTGGLARINQSAHNVAIKSACGGWYTGCTSNSPSEIGRSSTS
jgi:hypothetical protein